MYGAQYTAYIATISMFNIFEKEKIHSIRNDNI